MIRKLLAATLLLSSAAMAQAAPTDVVFLGGLDVTSTSGCAGYNPDKEFFIGTYWVPVVGSTNGPHSTLNFLNRGGGGEGFFLANDVFTSVYKPVEATHIFTLNGTYFAQLKVTKQTPATISTTTKTVTVAGAVKGWDRQVGCVVNFTMSLVKNLRP
jgi:hypothetical protein